MINHEKTTNGTGSLTDLDQIKVGGFLAERLDRAMTNLDDLSASVFWSCTGSWGYELAFRWLEYSLLKTQHTGLPNPRNAETAEHLTRLYEEGKLRYDYRAFKIGVYEDGQLIRSLVAYGRAAGNQRALEIASEVGQFIAMHHHLTDHYYSATAIAPLLSLSEATGDKTFLDLAIDIARNIQLKVLHLDEGTHGAAASMILDNYILLYERTGDPAFLDWALQGWAAMRERMFVTGGIAEVLSFTRPPGESDLHDETCQTAWWLLLNLHLWQVTEDTGYLDLSERILLNHFFFQQLHRGEGGFHAMGDIDQGFRGDHNYFCCDVEGTYAFFQFIRYLYTTDRRTNTVNINFFFDSEVGIELPGGQHIHLQQETDYPIRGNVKITIRSASDAVFKLRVRLPGQASFAFVRINSFVETSTIDKSYLVLDRTWQDGDTVDIIFPLATRVEADRTGAGARDAPAVIDGQPCEAKRIAVLYGNVVSAIFRCGHNNDLSWAWTGDYPEVLDSGGSAEDNYPGSRAAYYHDGQASHESTGIAESLDILSRGRIPLIRWTARLGEEVRVDYSVKVLPGLPLAMEVEESVSGWHGQGRLLVSGLRFATIKHSRNRRYMKRPNAWLYPCPAFTSYPDLARIQAIEYQEGTFGLYEKLEDGRPLGKTGTTMLNNGYFRAISLYNPDVIDRVTGRKTSEWVGVYLEPAPGPDGKTIIRRHLVIPLRDRPRSQTFVRQMLQRAREARVKVQGNGMLAVEGLTAENVIVLAPKATGLEAGGIVYNDLTASYLWDYDDDHLACLADVPGSYRYAAPAEKPESR